MGHYRTNDTPGLSHETQNYGSGHLSGSKASEEMQDDLEVN